MTGVADGHANRGSRSGEAVASPARVVALVVLLAWFARMAAGRGATFSPSASGRVSTAMTHWTPPVSHVPRLLRPQLLEGVMVEARAQLWPPRGVGGAERP
eukprot:5181873-Pyramimonas_sp.AAC.1